MTTQTPLTFDATKLGQRVILLQGADTEGGTVIRGHIVSRKDGWLGVRFDDGVTRMARAKTLTLDTTEVIPAKPAPAVEPKFAIQPASKIAQQPIGGTRSKAAPQPKPADAKARAIAARNARIDAAEPKPAKVAKVREPKVAKPGGPCLCACGAQAKAGRSFLPGHDARFHGWMKRLADERLKPSEVPAAALKLMNLDKDGVPTTDYDGTPWKP